MYSNISERTFRLILAGMVGVTAGELLAQDAAKADADSVTRTIVAIEADYEVLENDADVLMRSANDFLIQRRYEEAAKVYLQALELLKKLEINGPEVFGPKVTACQELIAKCYEYRAIDLMSEADEKAHQTDYNAAVKLLQKAMEIYPPYRERLTEEIEYYKRVAETDARVQEIANLIPNAAETKRTIEIALERGTRLLEAGDIDGARKNFESVLVLDPYNVIANQRLSVINRRIEKAANKRFEADHAGYMARANWTGVLDIVQDREAARNNILKKDTSIPGSQPQGAALMDKMQDIVIPKADMSELTLDQAVKLLRNYAEKYDPSGKGVNFLVRPDRVDQFSNAAKGGLNRVPGLADRGANGFGNANRGINTGFGAANRGATAGFGAANRGAATGLNAANGAAASPVPGQMNAVNRNLPFGAAGANNPNMMLPGTVDPMGLQDGQYAGSYGAQPAKLIGELVLPSNFEVTNANLSYIAEKICEALDIHEPIIDNNTVIFAAKNFDDVELETAHVPIDQSTLQELGGNSARIKQYLERSGCEFIGDAKVTYDSSLRLLSITNTPKQLARIMAIVDKSRPEVPQVMINVRFVEVRENVLKELGFNYSISRNVTNGNHRGRLEFDSFDTSGILTTLHNEDDRVMDTIFSVNGSHRDYETDENGARVLIGDYSFSANVNALDQLDGKDILSAPRILTLHNTPASISFLRDTPVPDWGEDDDDDDDDDDSNSSSSSSSSTDNGGDNSPVIYEWDSGQPSFNYEAYGITLNVTPIVDLKSRRIELNMNPVVTALVGWDSYITENESGLVENLPDDVIYKPITTRREILTNVVVRDGETIVLGGIITDETTVNHSKVPILGDIPLLGRLFRNENRDSSKMSLLVFVTCRLVGPDGAPMYTQPVDGKADFPMIQ